MALRPLIPKADLGTALPPNPDWEPPVPIAPVGSRDPRELAGVMAPVAPPPPPFGTADGGAGGGGITPPTDVGNASAALREIFAPAATEGALSPTVASVTEGGAAPVESTALAASPEAAAASSSSRRGGGGTGTWRGIDRWLGTLMDRLVNDSGMGSELLASLRNQATQTSKFRERDRITRRADDFAARGLFGSGLRKDAVMGIEGEESVALQGALNDIEFQNAQMIAQGLRDSIGVLNAMIAKKLGQGNLNIQREMLALEQAKLALQSDMFNWDKYTWKFNNTNPVDGTSDLAGILNPGVGDDPPLVGGGTGGGAGGPGGGGWRA